MTNIELIQQQIDALQDQLNTLRHKEYDWANAPVICELNGSKWLLGPEADEELDWDAAIEWCQTVGGELPPRTILLEAYMNEDIRREFITTYYWSSAELTATLAWAQYFNDGFQNYYDKNSESYVRAVKRLVI